MQTATLHVSPVHPLAQVHLLGAKHDPCLEHCTVPQAASRHSGPCQLASHLQTPGCWQVPCPQVPLQMGVAHVGPSHPTAHVQVSGAVHWPVTQDLLGEGFVWV